MTRDVATGEDAKAEAETNIKARTTTGGGETDEGRRRRRRRYRAMSETALELSSQEWNQLGQGDSHPTIAKGGVMRIAEKIVAVLFVRLVAVVSCRAACLYAAQSGAGGAKKKRASRGHIPHSDYSTTTVAQSTLLGSDGSGPAAVVDSDGVDGDGGGIGWADEIPSHVVDQLHRYVLAICENYRLVPYHNLEHAYHVFLNSNKLLDLMLREPATRGPTFGIKSDALLHMAFLFSALVHDVDHQGIPNRQLIAESDDLAILYNDQSVAEQRSLAVAFSFLKRPEFEALRGVLFQGNEDQVHFRKAVINLVMTTDIASPERTQIAKSLWKEAFGEAEKEVKIKKLRLPPKPSNGPPKPPNGPPKPSNGPPKPSNGGAADVCGAGADGKGEVKGGTVPTSYLLQDSKKEGGGGDGDQSNSDSVKRLRYRRRTIQDLESSLAQSNTSSGKDSLDINDATSSIRSSSTLDSELDSIDEFNCSIRSRMKMNLTEEGGVRMGEGSLSLQTLTGDFESVGFNRARSEGFEGELRVGGGSGGERSRCNAGWTLNDLGGRRKVKGKRGSRRLAYSLTYPSNPLTSLTRDNGQLGIRRALDFAGSTIEAFETKQHRSFTSEGGDDVMDIDDDDEVDELKASVVLEQMIKAADVGATLQDWENMVKWSTRLYKEHKSGFLDQRGDDPDVDWYDNQIKFFQFYILPLAQHLGSTGVFDDDASDFFVKCVENNLSRWIEEGMAVTTNMMRQDVEERKRKAQEEEEEERQQHQILQRGSSARGVPSRNMASSLNAGRSATSLGDELTSGGPVPFPQIRRSITTLWNTTDDVAAAVDVDVNLSPGTPSKGGSGEKNASANSILLMDSTSSAQSQSKKKGSGRKPRQARAIQGVESRPCVVCKNEGCFICPKCGTPYYSAQCYRENKAS